MLPLYQQDLKSFFILILILIEEETKNQPSSLQHQGPTWSLWQSPQPQVVVMISPPPPPTRAPLETLWASKGVPVLPLTP